MAAELGVNSHYKYPGRVGLQQRILPTYRAPFFEALSRSCELGLQVFAGEPLPGEGVATVNQLKDAKVVKTQNHHFFSPSSPFYLCWQEGLIKWLNAWNPDIVVMEANPRYLNTYRALRHLRTQKIPVIGWGLGAPDISGVSGKILKWQRSRFLSGFNALIAYSHIGAREFMRLGIPSRRIFVASNAVAPRPMGSIPSRSKTISAKPEVLFVGRLLPRKRVDLLINACAMLPPEIQPNLKIVGDGPARIELETLARREYPDTQFLGSIHGSDLEPIFASADLFVLPGTGGLAVQEAMANALPVIVARGDGTQEDLVRPGNGWQIPSDDYLALQQALIDALSDPGKLRRMGEESFRIVKEEINIETMVSVFLDALTSVT